jgi:hypothetical protein
VHRRRSVFRAVAAMVAAAVLGLAWPTVAVAAPSGPAPDTPAVHQSALTGTAAAQAAGTITPGVLMLSPIDENSANACTAAFVFSGGGKTYLGYAAHCAGAGTAMGLSGCRERSLPMGTTVLIEDKNGTRSNGRLAYSSWATMQQRGESDQSLCLLNDFALVQVDPGAVGSVDPTVPILGGPTALDSNGMTAGEPVFSYQPNNGGTVVKEGDVVSEGTGGRSHRVLTNPPGRPGDSGSGYLDGNGRAFGVLSVQFLDGSGANGVTDLAMALSYANRYGGIGRVALVPGRKPFAPPG